MMPEPYQEADELESDPNESEEKDAEITPLHYELSIYPADFTLEVLHQKWENGDIDIPKFQRGFVWDIKKASRLIESIMMGLPIPPVFFHLNEDNTYLVIDGRQRLESIFFFIDGIFHSAGKKHSFSIRGINPKNGLFGKTYKEFDEADKRKFKNYVLRATIIKQMNPKKDVTSIYHIFERLNTGGMRLLDQEVRNCIYEGKLNDLLLDLKQI